MKRNTYIFIGSVLCLLACLTPVSAAAKQSDLLTEIVAGRFKSEALPEMVPMADGEHYAEQVGNDVLVYAYKTGAVVDTLFSLEAVKGGVKPASIDGYMLSPLERYVLVYANRKGIYRHSFEADYYLYDRKRATMRALSDTMPVMAPVISPDGKYIAFHRGGNLYMHKVDFGTEVAVTGDREPLPTSGHAGGNILNGHADWLYEEEFGCTGMCAFSPDSKQLAFVRLDQTKVPQVRMFDGTTYRYSRAGETNAEATVVVYDTYYKSLKTMQLPEQADSYIPRLRWTNGSTESKGGKGEAQESKLAIFRLNRDQNRLEMFLANPKSTLCTRVYLEESKQYYVDYEAVDEWQFLEDNSFICVNETDGFRHAYLYSAQGIRQKQLTQGRYDVTKVYGFDEKTQTLYYQAADKDPMTRYIYALNVKKGKLTTFSEEKGMHDATFSPTFAYFVDACQSVTHPTVYTLYDRAGKAIRVLEDNAAVAAKAGQAGLPVKEFFTFVTPKGDTLNGWMLRPNDFDASKRYPVLMFHYSGPASQQVLNRWRISWEEYLALEEGVICVCVDPRGTNARGRAFRNQTYMQLGTKEMDDQVYAALYLRSLPYVDPERVGIWGWSYGGYATIMSMSACGLRPSLTPDGKSPFRFGMAVAPVTDWRLYDSAYTERFMRRPQVNEQGYKDASLIEHPDALQGNLLIMHGMTDDNVHVLHTFDYTDALVQKGVQFEMQIYPDDNHFLRKRNNQQHVYRRLLKFLREQIKQ